MKELSIEEKATRYDEALARANEMIKSMTNIGGVAKVDVRSKGNVSIYHLP